MFLSSSPLKKQKHINGIVLTIVASDSKSEWKFEELTGSEAAVSITGRSAACTINRKEKGVEFM